MTQAEEIVQTKKRNRRILYSMIEENENLTLLAVLFLSQNKKLMQDIGPVLTFLEDHKNSLDLLKKSFFSSNSKDTAQPKDPSDGKNEPPVSEENENRAAMSEERKTEAPISEPNEKKERPAIPLQGIASDEILSQIAAYLAHK